MVGVFAKIKATTNFHNNSDNNKKICTIIIVRGNETINYYQKRNDGHTVTLYISNIQYTQI